MRLSIMLVCLVLTACVTVRTLQVESIDPSGGEPIVVDSPVKVHLTDGSTVIFSKGVRVIDGEVTGEGFRYDPMLRLDGAVARIPLDEVAAMESFQTPVHTGATAAASTVTTAGGVFGGAALLKAIFGSCPTTYSFVDGSPVLEAESFSYSIAPGFETLDVDRLGIDGGESRVMLELRNEALETHYIDRFALLAVEHAPGQSVFADPEHRPLVLGALRPAAMARDSEGTDVAAILERTDGLATQASIERLEQAAAGDIRDFIELTFEVEPGEPVALVLRARNSLLNTVLLYDVMLAGQGFRAIDWMGSDLTRLLPRYRLANWYRDTMGLRVLIRDGTRYRQIGAFDDTGPIAWKDLALRLPPGDKAQVTLRLESVSDNWRIDRAAIAAVTGDASFAEVPLAVARDRVGARHETARDYLAADDAQYLVTKPGEFLQLEFDAGPLPDGRKRTFFLAATGYYIEWMRRDWLNTSARSTFRPDDAAIHAALGQWRDRREELLAEFDATRIPVR